VWNSGEIPRNFSKLILLINSLKNLQTWWQSPKNFSGISKEYFWRNSEEFRGEKFRRISQEFLETESQNWVSKLWSHKNFSSWRPILGNFSRIYEESVTGNDSREIPRKFLKESHHGWRIWGNSSLLLHRVIHKWIPSTVLLFRNTKVSVDTEHSFAVL